jgi:hypothetical protein
MASLQQNLEGLADAMGDAVKDIRVLINNDQANLSSLQTTNKTNIVSSINELKVRLDAIPLISDGTKSLTSTWSSTKIYDQITAALNGVLNNVPTALDTLKEIADAIGNDSNFAATIMSQLDKRVRWDTAAQGLTSSQQNNARINIGAASINDVGATDIDYVALFNQGLL